MRVCLGTLHASAPYTPLALLYLKAYLVGREVCRAEDVTILECSAAATAEAIADLILATDPAIVGLSCYVWNIVTFRRVCAVLKARRPEVIIVLGGPEVGPVGQAVLHHNPAVDVVVKSEGEVPFAEIVRARLAGAPLPTVAGLWCRVGDGVVDTGEAPILMDLNELPSPHRAEYADSAGRFICIETQRGCVFKCNFCFYNKDFSIRNRRFDLDRVKREILFWIERDVDGIYLMDPVFNLKAERAKEICRFIIEHNHRRVAIHAEVWAEFVDDELARLMAAANFRFVEVGLQTTEEAALAAVERRLRLGPFLAGVGHLKRHGIPFEVQLIYGLPGDTVDSFKRSLDFAATLDPPHLAVFPLMVLPGTELWHKAGALDLQYDPEPPYHVRSHRDMSAGDIAHGWRMVAALDLLGQSRTVRLLCRELKIGLSEVVDAWLASHAEEPPFANRWEAARAFITQFCHARDLPSAFYDAFARTEFRD